MKKIILVTIVFVSLLLSTAIGYCQEDITNYEWNVFFAAAEKWHAMLYETPEDWIADEEDYDRIFNEVAIAYGISLEDVEEIILDVVSFGSITDDDFEIVDELYRRLDAMPDWYTMEDTIRIHKELASQYGITLTQLHAIEFIDELLFWWLWDY